MPAKKPVKKTTKNSTVKPKKSVAEKVVKKIPTKKASVKKTSTHKVINNKVAPKIKNVNNRDQLNKKEQEMIKDNTLWIRILWLLFPGISLLWSRSYLTLLLFIIISVVLLGIINIALWFIWYLVMIILVIIKLPERAFNNSKWYLINIIKNWKGNHESIVDKKVDKIMTNLQKKLTFVTKFMEFDFIKSILSSKIIEDSNKWVKENLETISKIIGRVVVVFWAIGVLTTLWTMWVLIAYFGGGFIVLLLLNLIYILIGMLLWFGLIKMKKRVPFFITLVVLVDLAYIIIIWSLSWFGNIPSPRTVIFYIIFAIFVIKNKNLFNK